MKRRSVSLAGAVLVAWTSAFLPVFAAEPFNVIVFVGDGMGLEQVKLARCFDNGNTAPLNFENPALFPYFATMTHSNATGALTDSAASGTAIATGVKVNNGVISVRSPGDGSELETVLEHFKAQGRRTGLVTAATDLTDATPAAFGAHNISRNNKADILGDYLNQTRPNILFGQRSTSAFPDSNAYDALAAGAGYSVVHDTSELNALDPNLTTRVLGNWTSSTQPALAAMVTKALDILDNSPSGFFLLVENEDPDNGGHANSRTTTVNGVLSLHDAVDAALTWAGSRTDTLIIVTADHETGGLLVGPGPYTPGVNPSVTWSTTGHTQTPVGVWGFGPNAELISGVLENSDLFAIMTIPEPGAMWLLLATASLFVVRCRL